MKNLIEKFENELWNNQNFQIKNYLIKTKNKNSKIALYLILTELKTFYDEAMEIEIPNINEIYSNFITRIA